MSSTRLRLKVMVLITANPSMSGAMTRARPNGSLTTIAAITAVNRSPRRALLSARDDPATGMRLSLAAAGARQQTAAVVSIRAIPPPEPRTHHQARSEGTDADPRTEANSHMNDWDIVLRGGRVIDPESGLDQVRDVAVRGSAVEEIGSALPQGRTELGVAGLVVTAGFVDMHSHCSDVAGLRLQALDGVTTALELEAGVTPVAAAYRNAAAEGRPVNYGFAASWALARMEAVAGIKLDGRLGTFLANIGSPAWQRPAAPAEITALLARLAADLAEGALGIGVLVGYAPGTGPDEYLRVAGLAAEAGAPTFTHARDLIEMVPRAVIDGAEEIVRAAGETGAHMHYCHVNSTSQRHIGRVLGLVGRAQAAGARVTTEAYPYGSGMTGIGAAFLAPERLAERGLTPSSLTYVRTGERVASEARLRELRHADPGGLAIIELLDEDDPADRELLMRSLTFPGAVVASDAMPLTWTGPAPHPR